MYEQFFGFKTKPFALSPDPAFLYKSRQHEMALTMLEYGIESQAVICLLTGEIGSGKTTVVRQLLRSLGEKFAVGLISNTHRRFDSVLPWALAALGIKVSDKSDIAMYEALTDFVIAQYGKGRRTLLVVDEAQNLSVPLLEELRLLSNINSEQDVALQTLLVGQPELRGKLERPKLLQFAQRVTVDFHLNRLYLSETRAYIQHRLEVAGGDARLFQPKAIALVHERARGTPRVINQLCDLALVYAFAEQRRDIDERLVGEMIEERIQGRRLTALTTDAAIVALPHQGAAAEMTVPATKRM
jgi:type II secretory pathway predicted ATPase ExeA